MPAGQSAGVIRRLIAPIAVIAICGGTAFAAWRYFRAAPAVPTVADQLHSILISQDATRPFESRVCSHLPHRRFTKPAGQALSSDIERWRVASRLERVMVTLPSDGAPFSTASGLSMLYRGDTGAAIERFLDAVQLEPTEPSYWCDLAAASLVRGQPTDILQALEAAERALELEPNSPDAAFNRALALERIGLSERARVAWDAVREKSSDEGWAEEAGAHSVGLQSRATATFTADDLVGADHHHRVELAHLALDRTRQLLEDELMPRLGANCATPASHRCLDLLVGVRGVALAGAEASRDAWWTAVARQLEQWGGHGLDKERASALVDYGTAVQLFAKDQITQSAEIFRRLVARHDEPMVTVQWNAVYFVCVDSYFRAEHAVARTCLDNLERDAARQGFTFLRGKIEWVRAQISLTEGSLARASADFERAIGFLREAQDHNQTAAVVSLRATLLDQLGALDEAWTDRISALTQARLEPRRRHTLLTSAARSCLLQNFPRAALNFQDAAVQNANEWGQPGALVEVHLNQAVVLQRLRRSEDARRHLSIATEAFAKIGDTRARSRFEGEFPVMEGEVLAESSPVEALSTLKRASSMLSSIQLDLMRARLEHATGVAFERAGDLQQALAAYERGVAVIEQQREPLAPSVQMQSLDLAWDTYDRLIARRLDDEGSAAAFITAESARAQVLRRFQPTAVDPIPPLSKIQGLLPPQTALTYFLVLDRETVRWTISEAGVETVRHPIGRQRLDYLVRRVRRVLDEPSWKAPLRDASAPMYELLFSRAQPLPLGTKLVVIPDGPLHELPFGAVWDPVNGRHLIEEFPIAVAPSLRLFLTASRAARDRYRKLDGALIVEGRTGAVDGQEPLPALPSAGKEIQAVAASYATSRILSGPDATPRRFLAEAGTFPVVHFTGHALADRLAPDLSRLFLAPSDSDRNGWLLLRDIESASFARTGLVVLGACETGAGRVLRGEGAISLARPFLGKGAAGVVYSLWKVGDAPSMRLLTAFHAGVRDGHEPMIALQRAQRELIARGDDEIRTWAAFQYAGGILGER